MRIATPLLALALVGCPTPPDGGSTTNNPGGGGGGGGPAPAPMAGGADGVQPVANPDEADPAAAAGTYVVNEAQLGEDLTEIDQPSSAEAQSEIKKGAHVTFQGEIICNDCSNSLVITVAPFVPPSEAQGGTPSEPSDELDFRPPPFEVGGAGPFSMAVPVYKGKVVLEVLDDRDGNGRPSKGEKFTVLHKMGEISAAKNQSGLKIDFSALPGVPGGGPPAGGPPPAGEGAMPPGGPPPAN
jgi:hypothetical protein